MNQSRTTKRILALAPSTRGVGFAVLDGDTLADWGVKSVTTDKNAQSIVKVKELLDLYHPAWLVLEDAASTRRSSRIQKLHAQLVAVASKRQLKVKVLTRAKVRGTFFADGEGTKHALATILAERFTEELQFRLPRKRRAWMSEASGMGIFDAVALAVAARDRKSHEI